MKPRFRIGQVVLWGRRGEYVRIRDNYLGRMHPAHRISKCCIVEWPMGMITSTYERRLRPLTARECGPRPRRRK